MEQAQDSPVEVLVVEDNEADVYLTKTALSDATIANQVHVVGDGEEAMAFLNQEGAYGRAPRPDVVLLDLSLPKKDGFQVLQEMKADAHLKNIPVIVVRGSERPSAITRAYSLQIAAYLVKPLNVGDYFSAAPSRNFGSTASLRRQGKAAQPRLLRYRKLRRQYCKEEMNAV